MALKSLSRSPLCPRMPCLRLGMLGLHFTSHVSTTYTCEGTAVCPSDKDKVMVTPSTSALFWSFQQQLAQPHEAWNKLFSLIGNLAIPFSTDEQPQSRLACQSRTAVQHGGRAFSVSDIAHKWNQNIFVVQTVALIWTSKTEQHKRKVNTWKTQHSTRGWSSPAPVVLLHYFITPCCTLCF